MGGGCIDPHFHTWALAGGDWSASLPSRFTPGERAAGTHWRGGWVDPRASLDDVEKKNSSPYRDSNSNPSVVQPVASRYIDYAIPASLKDYVIKNSSDLIRNRTRDVTACSTVLQPTTLQQALRKAIGLCAS
jgi:hypothetical protein